MQMRSSLLQRQGCQSVSTPSTRHNSSRYLCYSPDHSGHLHAGCAWPACTNSSGTIGRAMLPAQQASQQTAKFIAAASSPTAASAAHAAAVSATQAGMQGFSNSSNSGKQLLPHTITACRHKAQQLFEQLSPGWPGAAGIREACNAPSAMLH